MQARSKQEFALNSRAAFLGVSLGNRTFSGVFAKRLGCWMKDGPLHSLSVVIFDRIEAINYVAFRHMEEEEALAATRRRGSGFVRMFQAALRPLAKPHTVSLESDSSVRTSSLYDSILGDLRSAYGSDRRFAEDVRQQVLINLVFRAERYGRAYIEARMDYFIEYILNEMTFLETYHRLHADTLEVYPGPNLLVKDKLWAGEYPQLRAYARPSGPPAFFDISFLKPPADLKPVAA